MIKKISYFLLTKSLGLYINILGIVSLPKALKLAYALFTEPRKGRLKPNELPSVLKQTETKTYRYKEQQFQTYTWKGNDTVILLIHGWESNSSRWENLLPYLQKSGSTIIAIDGPAHGLSDGKEFSVCNYAELMHIIVQETKPDYLIGHSLGGKTCLYYQSVYQDPSIKKIVTLGSPGDFKVVLQNFVNMLSLNARIATAFEKLYLNRMQVQSDDLSAPIYVTKIRTKGLIAHDIEDTVVLFKEGKKIANSWKNSILIETKGLGHSMHNDDLYDKISNFLFETE